MKLEVTAARKDEYDFLAKRAGYIIGPTFTAIAFRREGQIVGMVGYDGWTPNSCMIHIALDDAKILASREPLWAAFHYPFEQCGRDLVIGVTRSDNPRALRFNKGLGFRVTHVFRDGWDRGVDLITQEMRRDECRWLRRRPHGYAERFAQTVQG